MHGPTGVYRRNRPPRRGKTKDTPGVIRSGKRTKAACSSLHYDEDGSAHSSEEY